MGKKGLAKHLHGCHMEGEAGEQVESTKYSPNDSSARYLGYLDTVSCRMIDPRRYFNLRLCTPISRYEYRQSKASSSSSLRPLISSKLKSTFTPPFRSAG